MPPYIHQLLLCYDLTSGQGICVQYLSDSSTKSPRNIAQHSRVHRFLYLLHNIYWVNFRIRFSLSIFIHGFKKVHWSVCGLDKDWVISSEQVDESPQLIENLPFSIIWAEFSKLGSVTAVSCRVINVKCIGDATCYLTPPTLATALQTFSTFLPS